MTYLIFGVVAAALYGIAGITGLTYNTVNILVYYLIIPLTWTFMGDKIIEWRLPWLTMSCAAVWIVIFIATAGHFQKWCDWAFGCSVDFLNCFKVLKWNYYVASVYICVWLPLIIYAILAALLYWRHPDWRWQPLAIGTVSVLAIFWLVWWGTMTFAVDLVPQYQRSDIAYNLSQTEIEEIDAATAGMDAKQIANYAMRYTCDKQQAEGNCITYASLYTAVANQAFRHNGIDAQARHDVGIIKLFGYDTCKFSGPFKDHDFVTITTGDGSYSIDPLFKDLTGYDLKTKQ